jgi:acyl-coenzyme A synthetase/AMP-(fatty) acid ligase
MRALINASVTFPPIGVVISATASLPLDLARQVESRLGARVFEIYGCTESGYVATRWTTEGTAWQMRDDMRLLSFGEGHAVAADFLPAPVMLADIVDTIDNREFRLVGRSSDMLNIGGKRASLAGLTNLLMEIEGVEDGAIVVPEGKADDAEVRRLIAVVVAPRLSQEEIRKALRRRVDPAFVPRRIILVDALPRNATGKLPMDKLWAVVNEADRG